MAKYQLVFKGELQEGADASNCAQQLSRLFRQPADQLQGRLFSGRRVVVKRTDDEALVARFMQLFEQAGARLIVETVGLDVPDPKAPPVSTKPVAANEDLDDMRTRQRPVVPEFDDRNVAPGDRELTKKRPAVPDEDDRHKRRTGRRRRRGK